MLFSVIIESKLKHDPSLIYAPFRNPACGMVPGLSQLVPVMEASGVWRQPPPIVRKSLCSLFVSIL